MVIGKKSGTLAAVAFATTLLSTGSALAVPIVVDNITFGTNSNIKSTTIWENIVLAAGDTLTGIGRVNVIESTLGCGGICWITGANPFNPANMELTFTFSYLVEKVTVLSATTAEAFFSGGIIKFYSDITPDFTNNGLGGQGTDFANASDGNLWLDLVGAGTGTVCDATCFSGAGVPVVLQSTFTIAGSNLADVSAGSGNGFLNVFGAAGLANVYFDTNTFPGGQDMSLTSAFSEDVTFPAGSNFPLTGTAQIQSSAKQIPEPGTLVLLGAGLLGLGWFTRRRHLRA